MRIMKTVVIVSGGVALILASVCWRQHNQIQTLHKQAAVTTRRVTSPGRIKSPVAVAPSVAPQSTSKSLVSPSAGISNEVEGRADKAAEKTPSLMAKMMKDGTARTIYEGILEVQYGALFKGINLAPGEEEACRKLLSDRAMATIELSMSSRRDAPTAEDRKQQASQQKELQKKYDEKLKALLGPENFDLFTQYEATQPERVDVNAFKEKLPAGLELSLEQEDQLIRSMQEERLRVVPASKADAATMPEPFNATTQLQLFDQIKAGYLQRAVDILNPEQLEQFKKSQARQRELAKMGLGFVSQSMSGK
ncbi:MAG: hypothetical protein WCP12_15985 [bacterium]